MLPLLARQLLGPLVVSLFWVIWLQCRLQLTWADTNQEGAREALLAAVSHLPAQHNQANNVALQLAGSSLEAGSGSNLLQANLSYRPHYARPPSEDEPSKFERLIARILSSLPAGQLQQAVGQPAHHINHLHDLGQASQAPARADANNRTTMRFFQNNRTFASIVYTNEPGSEVAHRLISCYLVDLEKHSKDVEKFELKYGLKTANIEFRDMMQLIECCTDIERIKPLFRSHPSGPGANNHGNHSNNNNNNNNNNSLVALKLLAKSRPPFLVVTRPEIPATATASAHGGGGGGGGGPRHRRQQRAEHPKPAGKGKRPLSGHSDHALEQGGKHLVLGEVTTPPELESSRARLVDAIQEISSYDSSDLFAVWRGILPGTNWCGMGDRATSYNHLGFEAEVDICCRAHDFCPIRLSAFSSGYGLFNWSFYTRSHCWCDQNFLDCLQRSSSLLAPVVLKFYFNLMRTTCLHDNETIEEPPGLKGRQLKEPLSEGPLRLQDLRQQKSLLEQIKAQAPIPAQQHSRPIKSKFELHLKVLQQAASRQHQSQQLQQSLAKAAARDSTSGKHGQLLRLE